MITRLNKETGREELVSAHEFMDWVAPKVSCGRRAQALAILADGGIYETPKVAYYIKPIRSAKRIWGVRTNEGYQKNNHQRSHSRSV